ncbi:MAG: HAMP domain-containing sensor histidine kinase [Pseudomonadota bacterium]
MKFRIGIYWKIFSTILVSMLLSSLVITALYMGFAPLAEVHPHLKETLTSHTASIAQGIAEQLHSTSRPLESILQELHTNKKLDFRVYDERGKELASFMERRLQQAGKISALTIRQALQTGGDFQITYPRLLLTPVVTVPLRTDTTTTLLLQCHYPITKELRSVMPRGLPETVVIIILGAVTGLLSRYLTRPLRELTRVAKKMAAGNFGEKVKIRSHDEVGQLAKTFNEMSQNLAELQRSRKELFADISHELRSPLARILTDAEILIDRQMEQKEQEQHLKAICNEVENLNHLIGDLSMLARMEQDQVNISMRRYLLQDVILQAVSLFMLQMEEQGIELKQNISGNVPPVMIDPQRIGQVISNILTNAFRYTPPGGTIEVGLRQKGSMAEVWITDTGEGVPADKLPFIFERFYRVDKSRSRATGGSGLGLAIARKFIETHSGEIFAESRLGEGTCIIFTLPIAA